MAKKKEIPAPQDITGPAVASEAVASSAATPPVEKPAGTLLPDIPRAKTEEGGIGNLADPAAEFPLLARAAQEWMATHSTSPTHVRIVASLDGFRRAGIAHSRAPVDHPVEAFDGPAALEALLAEPNLTVTFI